MKRIIGIILTFSFLLSFASCRNIDEINKETTVPTTVAAPPVVKEKKQAKEFKDKNGRTVCVVDVVLPEISENIEQSMIDYVNGVINKFFEDACIQAEKNIESAAEFMDKNSSDKPWKKTLTFETAYLSGYYVSFLISESFSYYGSSDNTPSVYARSFSIREGNPVNASYFSENSEAPEVAAGNIADMMRSKAKTEFYEGGFELDENKLAAFDEAVSLDNFWLTENGMAFFVSRGAIDPYENSGIYSVEFTWDELAGIFVKPELY